MYAYTSRNNTYRYDVDLLKGVAIISVLLYHAGWCKSGYLGVDVFLKLVRLESVGFGLLVRH